MATKVNTIHFNKLYKYSALGTYLVSADYNNIIRYADPLEVALSAL
jgi:hypothetical protein